jgi:hypothetical protein
MEELPAIDSRWVHHSGRIYTVTLITNSAHPSHKFPVTIVYTGEDGDVWSRPAYYWQRSFTREQIA